MPLVLVNRHIRAMNEGLSQVPPSRGGPQRKPHPSVACWYRAPSEGRASRDLKPPRFVATVSGQHALLAGLVPRSRDTDPAGLVAAQATETARDCSDRRRVELACADVTAHSAVLIAPDVEQRLLRTANGVVPTHAAGCT